MASTEASAIINAPADTVWGLVNELKRREDSNTLFTKGKSEPPATVEHGTQAVAVMNIMGMANTITLTVDQYDAPKKMVLSGIGPAGANVTLTLSLEPIGETTQLVAEADFVSQMMVGAIGGAIERAAKKELEASLAKAAALVE